MKRHTAIAIYIYTKHKTKPFAGLSSATNSRPAIVSQISIRLSVHLFTVFINSYEWWFSPWSCLYEFITVGGLCAWCIAYFLECHRVWPVLHLIALARLQLPVWPYHIKNCSFQVWLLQLPVWLLQLLVCPLPHQDLQQIQCQHLKFKAHHMTVIWIQFHHINCNLV